MSKRWILDSKVSVGERSDHMFKQYTSDELIIAAVNNTHDRDYWINKLSGKLAKANFPYDNLLTNEMIYHSSSKNIPDIVTTKLLNLSKQSDYTLHLILVAALTILLNKYNQNNQDILIGTPIYKQDIAGEFINKTIAIRNQFADTTSFKDLLIQVRQTVKEAIEHQNYPLITLIDQLDLEEYSDQNSLFDIVLLVENIQDKSYLRDTKYKVLFSFLRKDQGIQMNVEYLSALYEVKTIERISDHLFNMLENALTDISLLIKDITVLSSIEKAKILHEFNNKVLDFPRQMTISQVIEDIVSEYPNKIAVQYGKMKCTYQQLNEQANCLARFLRQKAIGVDQLVVILGERNLKMLYGILAVIKAGGAYIPIDPNHPIERIKMILEDSGATVVLLTSDLSEQIPDLFNELGSVIELKNIICLDKLHELDKLHALFQTVKFQTFLEKVENINFTPDISLSLSDGEQRMDYVQYMEKSDRLKKFMTENLQIDSMVGIISEKPLNKIVIITALKKIGLEYAIINPRLSLQQKKDLLRTNHVEIIISETEFIKELNHYFWESKNLNTYINIDEYEFENNEKVNHEKELWDYISATTEHNINGYGWTNSYTTEPFTLEEIQQYIDNFMIKLQPYLDKEKKVLEIGCGHGLVLSNIAPQVKYYLATDLSQVILDKNKTQYNFDNVDYQQFSASEIDQIKEQEFDVVVISSVIQYFPDNFFVEKMIRGVIKVLKDEGIIYLDDLMNLQKKEDLIQSTLQFRDTHPKFNTKIFWEDDLFIAPEFFEYLQSKYPEIQECVITNKLGSIENELTKFRYDVMLKINKKQVKKKQRPNKKTLYTCEDIRETKININPDFKLRTTGNFSSLLGGVFDCTSYVDYSGLNLENINSPADLCYVIYTSGSTGKPKGAMVEHLGMMNHINAKIADLQITHDSIIAQNASHCFDISVWQFFAALAKGGRTVIYDNDLVVDPENLINKVVEDQITVLEFVPSYLSVVLDILEKDWRELKELQYLLVTGEAVKPHLIQRWFEKNPQIKVVNAYGPTEASDDVTHYIMDKPVESRIVPIGTPLPNFHIYILDENMQLCPIGVKGEICVAGIGVGRGYLNDPEKTQRAFTLDPFSEEKGVKLYKTGDIGQWTDDGNILFYGRKDYQVKIRGYRIEINEIESKLLSHPEIKETVVVDGEDEYGNKYLCAYIVFNQRLEINHLRKYLQETLPEYMVPAFFVELTNLPLTANGKVDRKSLYNTVDIINTTDHIEPRNKEEKILLKIWKNILKKEKISINDNFFKIGGHSLNTVLLVSKIYKEFQVQLPLGQVFEKATIRELAELIGTLEESVYQTIEPVAKRKYYPTSGAQRRLYILSKFDETGISYNIPMALEIEGHLKHDKLDKVFTQLINRHEAFQTSFDVIGGEISQKINQEVNFVINYIELVESAIAETVRNFVQPFDLTKPPLFRASLLKITETRYILLTDMHHIISDAISMNILIDEFIRLYEGGELAPLDIQYKDYVVWQQRLLTTDKWKKQEEFWLNELSGNIPQLNLPIDYPRPAIQSFEGATIDFEINEKLTTRLREMAQETDTTMYMALLAVYNILLAKYSNQTDIIIGSPIAGRSHPDLEKVIGIFVNTLIMRNYPEDYKTFYDFLTDVRTKALKIYENQDYQMDELVEKLGIQTNSDRNPLFDVAFNMLIFEKDNFDMKDLQIRSYPSTNQTSKFDLTLFAVENKTNISASFEYCTKLFSKETIEDFAQDFLKIIEIVTADRFIKLHEISIIDQAENEVLTDFIEKYQNSIDEDFDFI